MNRSFALSAVCAAMVAIACPAALAQANNGLKVSKSTSGSPSLKKQAQQTPSPAPVADTTQPLSTAQLDIANRVMTGNAQCEFDQQVSVEAIAGKPGHFRVGYKKATYTMVPEETTTGAVRLEDKKAGVIWVQIPSKSMLLNSKIGQRMVDSCTQAQQRAAL